MSLQSQLICSRTDRGAYDYFRLPELETNSYDEAQGASQADLAHSEELEAMRFRVAALRTRKQLNYLHDLDSSKEDESE